MGRATVTKEGSQRKKKTKDAYRDSTVRKKVRVVVRHQKKSQTKTPFRKKEEVLRSEEQAKFLVKASTILYSSLDYEKTLKTIADLIVPHLAEWCTVDIKDDDGTIHQLAVAHADPNMVKYAKELNRKYPPRYDENQGVGLLLRTGEAQFIPEITDEMLREGVKDKEQLRIVRELRLGSYMGIPMIARGRTVGVISFCTTVGKRYTDADFAFAKELASRAAIAVDNARLFSEKSYLANIIESSTDAIVGKTLDGFITSWNKGAEVLYGYRGEEIVGKPVDILCVPDRKDEIPKILDRLKKGEMVENYITRRQRKNGEIIDVSLTVSPIKDAMGRIIGASAIARDITELVLAEEKARKSQGELQQLNAELEDRIALRTEELRAALQKDRANLYRLKAMLTHLPMAALMMDEAGKIIELNDRYCEMFHIGLTAEEAMKISPEELNERFHKSLADPEHHMEKVNATMKARKPLLGFDIPLKDGRIIQRDFLPISDDGEFRGLLFLYRDVTRERRIDATKSEFMSLASHQLRTPLTAIRWLFGRLQKNLKGKIGTEEEELLEDGRLAAARMAETINTMLQISRIQAGEVKPNDTFISLSSFLEEIVEIYTTEYQAKDQEVRIECEEGMQIETDPLLLKEVLTNLFSNAIKYTPEKGTLRFAVSELSNTISIILQDSGYGIPVHQQSKVFNKFFRGDNVISRDPNGTGLGLYLVSLLTHVLGGHITFESAEGRGTTFTLSFPKKK